MNLQKECYTTAEELGYMVYSYSNEFDTGFRSQEAELVWQKKFIEEINRIRTVGTFPCRDKQ